MRHIVCGLTPVLVLVSISAMARAEPIVGIGNGDIAQHGILYSVDPISGAVAPLGPSGTSAGFYPVSPSPVVGSYFALSPVNHYLLTYPKAGTLDSPEFSLWDNSLVGLGDYAYDSSNGKLFALRLGLQNAPPAAGLVLLTDTGTSFPNRPNSHSLTATLLASAPVFPALSLIEYIQGFGLYGTDGHAAYLIDETTGAATQLPSLAYTGPIITGLAYDPASGRLIGTSGSLFPSTNMRSYIYGINPLTGQVTVLNSDAPNMFGLSAVSIPEPSAMFLLAVGILCVWPRRFAPRGFVSLRT